MTLLSLFSTYTAFCYTPYHRTMETSTTQKESMTQYVESVSLAGATVVVPARAPATVRHASGELRRFLGILTGKPSRETKTVPTRGVYVALGGVAAREAGALATRATVSEQGFRLRAHPRGVAIAAATPVGLLYGVYALLEELGMGFYAGGETYPDLPTGASASTGLDRTERPVFRARGNMLHYNFLCGPTCWGEADYRFYFEQLARMRGNVLLMHWYNHEPGAAYVWDGEVRDGNRTPNSLARQWGAPSALRTSEFAFGSGRWFDAEIFSSPAGQDLPDAFTEICRTEALWAASVRHARGLGIGVAAGFEAPTESPFAPQVMDRFRTRVRQFLARNPDIAYFALWQHEGAAIVGAPPPENGTPEAALLERQRAWFEHLGAENRVWEAVRYGAFASEAAHLLARERPDLRLVVVGWGGDRWMRFADLCLGYDRLLPESVIFTCHDNIDADFGPAVSTPWGKLPPTRERWAMPWVEGDIDECWVRQPHVETLGRLAPDALRKGCQGLLTLQWRTRDVEEETGYALRFAWQPDLTPEAFYGRLARHAFGPEREQRLARLLGELQRLGARWTGVRGSVECGTMRWTGHAPHYPFDFDRTVCAFLQPLAERASDILSIVPPHQRDGLQGAYHLRPDTAEASEPRDPGRLGVAEFADYARRIAAWAGLEDLEAVRHNLRGLYEEAHGLRARLLHYGLYGKSFCGVDDFLLALHHLLRNAGASWKMPRLRVLRAALERERAELLREGRAARLERLDYLAATMDFVLRYDTVAMLLATGEQADVAEAAARTARDRGDFAAAASLVAEAYTEIVEAGMPAAVDALTRKLTTRCDFGVLATFNVKALGLYGPSLARLEEFMPAVPPREVRVATRPGEAGLSWRCTGRAAGGYHLYRRSVGGGAWKRLSREPVAAGTRYAEDCMSVDRPSREGRYEYAVTALDGAGWESPRSHGVLADCRREAAPDALRIVASKPSAWASPGQDWPVRVVVSGERTVREVVLCYRALHTGSWIQVPLLRAFRDVWIGAIPTAALSVGGMLAWRVEARGTCGELVCWPPDEALPWSLAVETV